MGLPVSALNNAMTPNGNRKNRTKNSPAGAASHATGETLARAASAKRAPYPLTATATGGQSHTAARHSTTDSPMFIPNPAHSPARASASDCRLKEENVV